MGRRRPVGEHVPKMAATGRAVYLSPDHAEAAVGCRFNRSLDRIVEAGPTGITLKF